MYWCVDGRSDGVKCFQGNGYPWEPSLGGVYPLRLGLSPLIETHDQSRVETRRVLEMGVEVHGYAGPGESNAPGSQVSIVYQVVEEPSQ